MGKVAYLFTTFPKLSERFFLREVEALRAQGFDFDLYSLIGGRSESSAGPVGEMGLWGWLCLPFEILYWLTAQPRTVLLLLRKLFSFGYGSWTNLAENLLGAAFAIRSARRFRDAQYHCSHATWATAPAMAAWVLQALIELPYTMEAHAYDVFRDGGDRFLVEKLRGAQAVRSSTEATSVALRERLGDQTDVEVTCVRRGLTDIPAYAAPLAIGEVMHVLSVGRLIEKKGYDQQLQLYAQWAQAGVPFRASIVGDGPLYSMLEEQINALGLVEFVCLTGKLEYAAVEAKYREADLFLFSGRISASGDRDGFPNVIGEAMAASVPVFSTDVSGTTEGIRDGETGYLIELSDMETLSARMLRLMRDTQALQHVTTEAYRWIQESFSVDENVRRLRAALWEREL